MNGRAPIIIQGGMGAGVSNWELARAVSLQGQMGVVSGTALDTIAARRLQDGDPGGHMRRALDHFPFQSIADKIRRRYFIEGGKPPNKPYLRIPMWQTDPRPDQLGLAVWANFAEVFLAKEHHDGAVGINYLEKIQLPHLASIYGAMLAGVGFILMGAGIPVQIAGIIDAFAQGEPASMRIHVEGASSSDDYRIHFDPALITEERIQLARPNFLPIISSATLGEMLISKSSGAINGFIVELPTAGGHNAPPRGRLELNQKGEPIYGERDEVDFERMRALGRPFWIAGSYGSPTRLRRALEQGAQGIQVGTAFALSRESALDPGVKKRLLQAALDGRLEIFTDPLASPSGFPFKVAQLPGTLSDREVFLARQRVCDLGYLRHPYKKEDGSVGHRCPSEPVRDFLTKGGKIEETESRKCLCNALLSNIGQPQTQKNGDTELPLVTLGDDTSFLRDLLPEGETSYSAADVIQYLLGEAVDLPPGIEAAAAVV